MNVLGKNNNHGFSYLENEVKLKNEISIHGKRIHLQEKFSKKFVLNKKIVSFYFCFSGGEESKMDTFKDSFIIRPGKLGFFFGAEGVEGNLDVPAENNFKIISLRLPGEVYENFFEEDLNISSEFRLENLTRKKCYFDRSVKMSPMIKVALGQLMNCDLKGNLKDLYSQGKCLELIACALNELSIGESCRNYFPEAELKKIDEAGFILGKNLVNPPALMELASMVGIHHSKLNRGFRKKHGTTVFGFITRLRLEKARQFLEKGDMNCTEAAMAVGYSSLSHFAKAFKNQYNVNPSYYLKRISPVK